MTVPHYGKREAGALTAASPGDTLYFNFGAYNDSGDSELLSGFAVSDIEVFKNGGATARATDSGYSLISDTGMIGNRVGLYRFSVQLFNTADDATFYADGGWYQVAVDAVTIDGKTVRAWVGSFEIGRQRTDVRAVLGDTGAAHLDQGRFGVISDSGRQAAVLDTGKVASAIWTSHATRALTAFPHDTGVAQAVWRASSSTFTSDTGSVGYAQGRLMAVRNDTGAAHLDQGRLGVISDSGRQAAVLDTGKVAAAVWTSHATRILSAFPHDTGVRDTVWSASPSSYTSDTGSFGYTAGRLMAVRNDTGAAHLDGGRLGVSSAVAVDTGSVNNAVWNGLRADHLTAGTFGLRVNSNLTAVLTDTGAAHLDAGRLGVSASAVVDTGVMVNAVWRATVSQHTSDTGATAYGLGRLMAVRSDTGAAHLDAGRLGVSATATLDTGVVNQAVWQADASRVLTAFPHDTGVADAVWKYGDTGARMVNVRKIHNDTGASAHLQQAFATHNTNSDTGLIANAEAVRTQTDKFVFTVANQVDANIQYVNNVQVAGTGDTGAADTWRPV